MIDDDDDGDDDDDDDDEDAMDCSVNCSVMQPVVIDVKLYSLRSVKAVSAALFAIAIAIATCLSPC